MGEILDRPRFEKVMISEWFYSIQGEGPNAGRPSVFLRTTGCNLRCFEKNTQVLMGNFTYKAIQDIQIGDEVIGFEYNGMLKKTKVLRTFINENHGQSLVKVSNNQGEVYCTPEHQFRADWWDKDIESEWIEAKKIDSRKIRYYPFLDIKAPDTPEYHKGYITGSIFGDGSISGKDRYLSFGTIDKQYMEEFLKSYKVVFGIDRNIYANRRCKTTNNIFYEMRDSSRVRVPQLDDLQNQWENSISIDFRKGFIAGIFDSEGSYSKSENFGIGQVEPKMIEILDKWLQEFGYETNVKERPNKTTSTGSHFELAIFGDIYKRVQFLKEFGCKIDRKWGQLYNKKLNHKGEGATKVQETDHKPLYVYDLETETHNYIANGFQVHNCPGWGTTGCDTTEVWKKGESYYVEDIWKKWKVWKWAEALNNGSMLTITGGEPLIHQKNLVSLLTYLKTVKCEPYIEVETNTTYQPSPEFASFITHWNCSPKLSSAGDPEAKRYNPGSLQWFSDQPNSIFKFVINVTKEGAIAQDLAEIQVLMDKHKIKKEKIYLMPEGATKEAYLKNALPVIEICKEKGFRFSPRLHIGYWDRTTGV